MKWLAQGPYPHAFSYPSYLINNYRFHIKDRDNNKTTQNSEVTLVAETEQIASAKDKNPIFGEMPYYGVIKEIWALDYHMIQIPIFKCD